MPTGWEPATHFHSFIYLCDVLKVKSINFCYLEISKCCEEITCVPSLFLRQLFISSLIFGMSFTSAVEVIRAALATGCQVLGGAENFSLFQLPKENRLILVVGPGFPIHACPPFPEWGGTLVSSINPGTLSRCRPTAAQRPLTTRSQVRVCPTLMGKEPH